MIGGRATKLKRMMTLTALTDKYLAVKTYGSSANWNLTVIHRLRDYILNEQLHHN